MFISEGFSFNREGIENKTGEAKQKLDYSVENDYMDLDDYLADVEKQNKIKILQPKRQDSSTGFFESETMLANKTSRDPSKI